MVRLRITLVVSVLSAALLCLGWPVGVSAVCIGADGHLVHQATAQSDVACEHHDSEPCANLTFDDRGCQPDPCRYVQAGAYATPTRSNGRGTSASDRAGAATAPGIAVLSLVVLRQGPAPVLHQFALRLRELILSTVLRC